MYIKSPHFIELPMKIHITLNDKSLSHLDIKCSLPKLCSDLNGEFGIEWNKEIIEVVNWRETRKVNYAKGVLDKA